MQNDMATSYSSEYSEHHSFEYYSKGLFVLCSSFFSGSGAFHERLHIYPVVGCFTSGIDIAKDRIAQRLSVSLPKDTDKVG